MESCRRQLADMSNHKSGSQQTRLSLRVIRPRANTQKGRFSKQPDRVEDLPHRVIGNDAVSYLIDKYFVPKPQIAIQLLGEEPQSFAHLRVKPSGVGRIAPDKRMHSGSIFF